jgi:hypothetical protein
MIVFRIVSNVVDHFVMRLAEWGCSAVLFGLGLRYLTKEGIFHNPAFAVISGIASQQFWGHVFMAIGFARLMSLTLNGTFSWSAKVSLVCRSLCASISVLIWFILAAGIFMSDGSPGFIAYSGYMFTDAYVAIYTSYKVGKLCSKKETRA